MAKERHPKYAANSDGGPICLRATSRRRVRGDWSGFKRCMNMI
jgi:hypothetical protein